MQSGGNINVDTEKRIGNGCWRRNVSTTRRTGNGFSRESIRSEARSWLTIGATIAGTGIGTVNGEEPTNSSIVVSPRTSSPTIFATGFQGSSGRRRAELQQRSFSGAHFLSSNASWSASSAQAWRGATTATTGTLTISFQSPRSISPIQTSFDAASISQTFDRSGPGRISEKANGSPIRNFHWGCEHEGAQGHLARGVATARPQAAVGMVRGPRPGHPVFTQPGTLPFRQLAVDQGRDGSHRRSAHPAGVHHRVGPVIEDHRT